MPRFYTCRAVIDPLAKAPAFRLCLKPTVNGLHCAAHAAQPEAAPAVAVTGAKPPEPMPVKAAAPDEETPEQAAARRARFPLWPDNDDGSPCHMNQHGARP